MNAKKLRGIEFLFEGAHGLTQKITTPTTVQFGVVSRRRDPFNIVGEHDLTGPRRIFLLSPANIAGIRARLAMRARCMHQMNPEHPDPDPSDHSAAADVLLREEREDDEEEEGDGKDRKDDDNDGDHGYSE